MKKQIILINGSGGVGKDTFINFCNTHVNVLNISTVDKVKEAAKLLGWTGGKNDIDRLFLSNLKLLSVGYSDHSFNYIKDSIETFLNPISREARLMFIHVREPDEISRFKHNFKCHTMLIKNENIPKILSNMSDANVNNYKYDFVIDNSSDLEQLCWKAKEFVYSLFNS